LFVLGQGGNACLWELIGDFPDSPRICPHRWISEEYISRAAAAGHQQFQSGRAFEMADATLDQHAERVGQLCVLICTRQRFASPPNNSKVRSTLEATTSG
jgi:hypothetical protein